MSDHAPISTPSQTSPPAALTVARRLVVALGLGTIGGAVFSAAGLPLPWMLGSMAVVTAAALSGRVRPAVPAPLRLGMLAVLGVMLGSAFTPDLVDDLGAWAPSLLLLVAVSAFTPFVAGRIFRRLGKADPVTAYFSGTPGGLNEMVSVGAAMGGDERTIALVHALRILIVVFVVALLFRLFHGEAAGAGLATGDPRLLDGTFPLADLAWLVGAAVVGVPLGRVARLPAPILSGPMIVSAALHLGGVTALGPPVEVLVVAQVVVGSALGGRFVGTSAAMLMRTAGLSLVSSLVMLVLAGGAAWAMAAGTGLPFFLLLLAYVPGGVAEMSLIALALGADVPFVASHHVVRIALVIALAPLLFRFVGRE